MPNLTERLDAEIDTLQTQLDARKKELKTATGVARENAATQLRALVTRLDALEATRRTLPQDH